jgi:hypothetical protein
MPSLTNHILENVILNRDLLVHYHHDRRRHTGSAKVTAGALWDPHRAKLVGEMTFGTGAVLNEFNLSDGSA